MLINIFSLTLQQLEEQLVKLNLKKFNAKQIFQWTYKKHIYDFINMKNISKVNLEILKQKYSFNFLKINKQIVDSKDETVKFLFELKDNKMIETVLMKYEYGYSVCISTQVGCNMGCKFCASGIDKKIRDLTPDEIILQFLQVNNWLREKNGKTISNIVVMGIGEPFDNYQNLSISLKIFNEPYGIFLGARHITISTCGLIDKINQFSIDFPQINLSISLHSPIDKVRSEIMPINRKYNIQNLIDSLKQYIKKTRRRISFEYILLDDINDSDEDALLLAKLIKGMNCYVNLILYNIVSEHNYIRSKRVKQFNDILKQNKIVSTIRLERGSSISATCGKLRIQYEK